MGEPKPFSRVKWTEQGGGCSITQMTKSLFSEYDQ